MPWKVTCSMDERFKFVAEALEETESMTSLCAAYGISRPTGYKWLDRYRTEGPAGLADRSRAAHSHPNAVDDATRRLILQARVEHPTWGPKKILAWLARQHPGWRSWPAPSTVGAWLKDLGLAAPRRRRRTASPTAPTDRTDGDRPNRVWTADFKGWFRLGDGTRCDPLTVMDDFSRFVLLCRSAARTDTLTVRGLLERLFREVGLPDAMRTDNGAPFASSGLAGLSRLSVWLLTLGVRPERIEPGKPQQNGRHERMHRTLKQETARPPARTSRTQQRRFDHFVEEFNHERPHEALEMRTPASLYAPSSKALPARPPAIEYPDEWPTRKVQKCGQIYWRHQPLFLAETLSRQRVGLEPADDGLWRLWFASQPLAMFDERQMRITPLDKTDPKKPDRHGEPEKG